MPKIQAKCANCPAVYTTSNVALAGKAGKCAKCGGIVRFPKLPESTDAPVANEPAKPAVPAAPPAVKSVPVEQKPPVPVANEPAKPVAMPPPVMNRDDGPSPTRSEDDSNWFRNQDDEAPPRQEETSADEDENEPADDEDSDEPVAKPARRKSSRGLLIGIVAAVVVAIAGAAVFFLTRDDELKGEREIKELISAATEAKDDADPEKKLNAELRVLAQMLAIEQLKLTRAEQDALIAKYGDQLHNVDLGADAVFARKTREPPDQVPEPPEIDPTKEIDALLAELKDEQTFATAGQIDKVLKRIEEQIPIDSPRRADAYHALKAVWRKADDFGQGPPVVRQMARYAAAEDAIELAALLNDESLQKDPIALDAIADRLARFKNPESVGPIAKGLASFDDSVRRRAAATLRLLGALAEKTVQPYADPAQQPKVDVAGRDEVRLEALAILADIGTPNSVALLMSFKNEPADAQKVIANALQKIRQRHKLEVMPPDENPVTKTPAELEAAKAAFLKLGAKYNFNIVIEQGDPARHVFLMPSVTKDDDLKNLPEVSVPFELDLGQTEATDAGLVHLKGKKNLAALHLHTRPVTDEGMKALRDLPDLTTIGLAKTGITDAGLRELTDVPKLRSLNLNGTAVTDAGMLALRFASGLTHLAIGNTPVTKEGVKQLQDLQKLEYLELPAHATDAWLDSVGKFKNLKQLEISGSQVTGAGFQNIADLPSLTVLNLLDAKVTDDGVKELAKFKGLTRLNLEGNPITDEAVQHLKPLVNLQRLHLGRSKMTEEGIKELKEALPKCMIQ